MRFDAGELVHAMEHFLRGFVGEREQENFAGPHALRQEISDAVGERAGFAGAGAGQHEQRTGFGRDGGELLVIELRAKIDRRNLRERALFERKFHQRRNGRKEADQAQRKTGGFLFQRKPTAG